MSDEAVLPLNNETMGRLGAAIANAMGGNNRPLNIYLNGRAIASDTADLINRGEVRLNI